MVVHTNQSGIKISSLGDYTKRNNQVTQHKNTLNGI